MYFIDDTNIITDKVDMANKFIDFFTHAGKSLADDIQLLPPQKNHSTYLTKRYNNNFNFETIDADTVTSILIT